MREATKRKGDLIASVLAGAWLRSPPRLSISADELTEVAPLLLGSLAGALAWWKIQHSDLKTSPAGLELQEAYRFHTIRSALREHRVKQALSRLHSEGVEPILVKGWAVARLYPETGLRPYGDIDLAVRSDQYSASVAAKKGAGGEFNVDVHDGFRGLDFHRFDDMYERSSIVKLDDVNVRVLSPEDHLRVLCLHLLRHNAFRPLWLCDIAVAVESRPADFDWNCCLGKKRYRADWVACCLGLAHQLLGAEVDDTPAARRATNLPGWFVSNVLKQWETPYSMSQTPVTNRAPMAKYLRHPQGVLRDLRNRWPEPIEATVYVGGPFNELPRWPFQVGECVGRTAKFLARLPKTLRKAKGTDK